MRPRREIERALPVEAIEDGRGSGVRRCAPAVDVRILFIEPNPAERERFANRARESAVPLLIASSPATAHALRAQGEVDLIACAYPVGGAEALVQMLVHERFPVIVVTNDPKRAIEAFGLRVPILHKPAELSALLEQSLIVLGRL